MQQFNDKGDLINSQVGNMEDLMKLIENEAANVNHSIIAKWPDVGEDVTLNGLRFMVMKSSEKEHILIVKMI